MTEAVRRRPYSVVLFDEIEKAHPDVFNVLLQVLDDGRLTDSKGRTVDFKNTVLIMTSNVGAAQLSTAWAEGEEGFEEAKSRVMDELRKHFRPEFLNRVDDIVVFRPLGDEQLTHIVDLRLADLQKLLADRQDYAGDDGWRAEGDLQGWVRPGLWGAAVEAGDSADGAGSAGDEDSRWECAAWGSCGGEGWEEWPGV